MGRDLSFWKQKNSLQMNNSKIYQELTKGNYLDFICDIPSEEILKEFKVEFSEWEYSDDLYFKKGNELFQLYITKQFVRADCFSMNEKNMNKIIDILLKYQCPLYDSVIDVRFDEEY